MKNYTTLCKYAKKFTGEALAKDLVHNLWLRKYDLGVDILSESLSNRQIFVMVKNEYLNSFNKKNEQVHVKGKEFNQDREAVTKEAKKEAEQLSSVSNYGPFVFLDYAEVDSLVLSNIQRVIDSYGTTDPRAGNAAKYAPETIMKVYELVKQDCTIDEISKVLEIGTQSVFLFRKKIREICSFLKPCGIKKR